MPVFWCGLFSLWRVTGSSVGTWPYTHWMFLRFVWALKSYGNFSILFCHEKWILICRPKREGNLPADILAGFPLSLDWHRHFWWVSFWTINYWTHSFTAIMSWKKDATNAASVLIIARQIGWKWKGIIRKQRVPAPCVVAALICAPNRPCIYGAGRNMDSLINQNIENMW